MNNRIGGEVASITESNQRKSGVGRLAQVAHEEIRSLQPRLILARLVAGLIPRYTGARLRTQILRLAGLQIGRGTVIMGAPFIYGVGDIHSRLRIGTQAMINIGCTFDLSAPITIGDEAAIGHEVVILTSSHRIGFPSRRAGPLTTAPVVIGSGVWIGARSVVLPGVVVGEGSIIGAGAIVTRDVPANTMVAGVPARAIRTLDS